MVGSLPLFVGLAVVVPVLGHSTWHLYRKVVEPDPSARHEHLSAPKSGHRYAAQFPAVLFGGKEPPRPPPLKPVFEPATGRSKLHERAAQRSFWLASPWERSTL